MGERGPVSAGAGQVTDYRLGGVVGAGVLCALLFCLVAFVPPLGPIALEGVMPTVGALVFDGQSASLDAGIEASLAAMKFVAPEKLYPCTNCGMAPMSREVAYGKLAALAQGAEIVRCELGHG